MTVGSELQICAATGCQEEVAREMLMCRRHWFMVPRSLRKQVWDGYRGRLGSDYAHAVQRAVDAVARQEGR